MLRYYAASGQSIHAHDGIYLFGDALCHARCECLTCLVIRLMNQFADIAVDGRNDGIMLSGWHC